MEAENLIEEVIVSSKPWYSLLPTETWVVLAVSASAVALGALAWHQLQRELPGKLIIAGVSGLLCYSVFYFGFDGFWPSILFHSASGALFAAGVLFPYLKYDRVVWLRALGLMTLATFSYWAAIETASRTSVETFTVGTRAYVAASLVGAFIVLTGARFIVPLNRSMPLAVVGFVAAIIGGLVFALTDECGFLLSGFIAFSSWHALMGMAIHIAEGRSAFRCPDAG